MRTLLKENWKFKKMQPHATYEEAKADIGDFSIVSTPHDWAIDTFKGFYEDSTGWYFRQLDICAIPGKRWILYFDGIYMDSTVYINGEKVCEWKYGYTPFEVDITSYLREDENELAVCVNYFNLNSRWYSGAGITRNVWIDCLDNTYIPRYGIYANAVHENDCIWKLTVDTHIVQGGDGIHAKDLHSSETIEAGDFSIDHMLISGDGSVLDLDFVSKEMIENTQGKVTVRCVYRVKEPLIWDIESPNVYTIRAVFNDSQTEESIIGFRTIGFEADSGFRLNGRNIKLNGVCEHHDFGMIGGVFYEDAMERKILTLKNMGVNSIRFSHNPVDEKAIELCDRMGMLVLSEAFDMWVHPKTTYDYARFFPDWYRKDVHSWVRKDRNHPSVIMWSIGNEIYDIHLGEEGHEWVRELSRTVRRYDPLHNAYVTFCSNYMPWENAQKAAEDVEVVGYNYAEKYYEEHHKEHPEWIIYGSETSSIVYSRGVYRFPFEKACMTDDDSQCSCMGNSTTSWGAESFEECALFDLGLKYSAGQYLWTGFDYLGEPTPYHTKNSYFGQIDTAGFPKDSFYMWKSVWTKADANPMLYLSPYWDYNPGEIVDVRVISNACEVELFVNGESRGRKRLSIGEKGSRNIIAGYKVPFERGFIEAVGYDDKGNEIARDIRKSFSDTAEIICEEEVPELFGNPYEMRKYSSYGDELLFYDIYAVDRNGNRVENASDLVSVSIEGDGELLTLDNGDSTDYTDQKSPRKRLFYGKLLLVVKKTGSGPVNVSVSRCDDIVPVRRIELVSDYDFDFNPEERTKIIRAGVYPDNATDKEVSFRITDILGNDTNIARIAENNYCSDGTITIEALGDGDFKLRAFSKSSTDDVRVISQLVFSADGLGEAYRSAFDFIAGSAFSYGIGNITNGNERGAATERSAETILVYENIDFGTQGSDRISIPIFSLDHESIYVEVYDGKWGEDGCRMLCRGHYNHPQIWNVYQEDTYCFNECIRGLHTISIRAFDKIHIKGFRFGEYNPAYEQLNAVEATSIYGDSYEIREDVLAGIGNNVTVDFGFMDFGEKGPDIVTICGRANKNRNTIHLKISGEKENSRHILECDSSKELVTQQFDIPKITGRCKVELVFLPGCDYDLKWIRFGHK